MLLDFIVSTILVIIMIISVSLGIKGIKEKLTMSIFMISLFSLVIFFVFRSYNYGSSSDKKYKEESKIISERVKTIINKKTKHIKSKAYIYGIYLYNSPIEDEKIFKCYNKFHNIKTTAECVKAKVN